MGKVKRFEELSEAQQAAFHNMPTSDLFVLHDALRTLIRGGVCKPKLEICNACPVKRMTLSRVGYGGPMACSLVMLEAASRGRYVPLTAVEETVCDQCAETIPPRSRYVQVPQLGYRALNFCMRCVEGSQA